MKPQHLMNIPLLFAGLCATGIFSACVSVNLPSTSGKKSEAMTYTEPGKPFAEIKGGSADSAWQSEVTGNTISFISECGSASDPGLKQLEGESLSALGKLKIEDSLSATFSGRESLMTVATGEVDGVPVKTKLVIFKKNGCNYTLSYGGVEKKFAAELGYFDKFVQSFNVP